MVDLAAVREHYLDLLVMEGMVIFFHKPVGYRRATQDMLAHDPLGHVGLDVLVRCFVAVDDYIDEHVSCAEAPASDFVHGAVLLHSRPDAGGGDGLLERGHYFHAAGGDSARTHADFYRDFFIHDYSERSGARPDFSPCIAREEAKRFPQSYSIRYNQCTPA